jgi:hypothetical protein
MVTSSAPPTGVIDSMVLSTADAWNSSRHITKFLEGLKNREADREGIPFFLCYFNPLTLFADS